MLEFFRYDGRKRLRGGIYLSLGMVVLTAMILWVYPSFRDSFDEDQLLSAYPDQLLRLFDVETMSSLEGFLAFELYAFGWVILLALYFAYSAASIIAEDVDRGRMDTFLAMPVSRSRLLTERFASLIVPIGVVNIVTPPVVVGGGWLIGEQLSALDIAILHLFSVAYLFACAGIGILCSVIFDRVSVAQRVALGATFFLFLMESLVEGTEFEPVGSVTPMRYFSPNEMLLESTYDFPGLAVVVATTVGLLAVSAVIFTQKDI